MQEHGAAAAKNYAGANLDKARTDAVNGKGAAGAKPQALTTELTKAFFSKPVTDTDGQQKTDSQGRPVTQIDTDKLQNFMQFDNRPGVSANQNAALPQYMNTYGAQTDNPPPGAIGLGAALTGKPAAVAQPTASAKPRLQDWITKAKQANPGVSDDDLTAYYKNKYGAQNGNQPPSAIDLGAALSGKQSTPTATAAPASPSSQADFDALPSGALYVNPSDGKTYRKKKVVRTGTSADGRRVAQYDDGTVAYGGQ
ncbi:MAG TPA: hypothetical protein VN599_09905 [Rudaea sp.]|nr:hypothetical protein [Rudaea sp.]